MTHFSGLRSWTLLGGAAALGFVLIGQPAQAHGLAAADLLLLASEGLLEAPQASQLLGALDTLLGGGRVLELQAGGATPAGGGAQPQGLQPNLGQTLLLSGLQQIDVASAGCRLLLARREIHPLARLMLEGRLRELAWARRLLLWRPLP